MRITQNIFSFIEIECLVNLINYNKQKYVSTNKVLKTKTKITF